MKLSLSRFVVMRLFCMIPSLSCVVFKLDYLYPYPKSGAVLKVQGNLLQPKSSKAVSLKNCVHILAIK